MSLVAMSLTRALKLQRLVLRICVYAYTVKNRLLKICHEPIRKPKPKRLRMLRKATQNSRAISATTLLGYVVTQEDKAHP